MNSKKSKKTGRKKKAIKSHSAVYELYQDKKGVMKIAIILLALICLLLSISSTSWFLNWRIPITRAFAAMGSFVLDIVGYSTNVYGTVITSGNDFSVDIKQGCDAIAPMLVYCTTIMVFPTSLSNKMRGLFYGLGTMIILNILRIVTLFLLGIHFPEWFPFFHFQFWQVLFIVFVAALWITWYNNLANDAEIT